MKNISILSIMLLISFTAAKSQGCLPQGVTFQTQEQIDNFQVNYPGCTEIEGTVYITSGGSISDLSGLSILTSIGGELSITECIFLVDLSGLENLASVGGLDIELCNSLTNIDGLSGLTTIGGYIDIIDNLSLTSLEGLGNVISFEGWIDIQGNTELTSLAGLNGIESASSIFLYNNSSLQSLDGLNALTSVDMEFILENCPALTSLSGLESLSHVGSSFQVYTTGITDFTGLENLTEIGTEFWVSNESLVSFTGLDALTTIGKDLFVYGNYSLISLQGLNALTTLGTGFSGEGGQLIIYSNPVLTSLSGIDSIDAGSIVNFKIYSNPMLSDCDVESVCEYLAASTGEIEIHDNAVGCNTPGEVEDDCLVGIQENDNQNNEVVIYPNPASKTISVYATSGRKIDQVKIFDITGNLISKPILRDKIIDISSYKQGIYFLEISTETGSIKKRLILK